MNRTVIYPIIALVCALCGSAAFADTAAPPGFEAQYVGPGSGTIQVTLPSNPKTVVTYSVSPDAMMYLAKAKANDTLTLTFSNTAKPTLVTAIDIVSRPIDWWTRLWTLFFAFVFLFLIATWVTKGKPLSFITGLDNRYSNSQTQLVLWFGAVMTAYLATLVLRIHYLGWSYLGGINIPANLIVLSGLSAFSFGAARVIRQAKDASTGSTNGAADGGAAGGGAAGGGAAGGGAAGGGAADRGAADGGAAGGGAAGGGAADGGAADGGAADGGAADGGAAKVVAGPATKGAIAPPKPAAAPHITDLVQNDYHQADVGDFQMLLIAVIAVCIFLLKTFSTLGDLAVVTPTTLQDVDLTLLSLFGIGQGAYLVKKAGSAIGQG